MAMNKELIVTMVHSSSALEGDPLISISLISKPNPIHMISKLGVATMSCSQMTIRRETSLF
jgi:hypothetical protein